MLLIPNLPINKQLPLIRHLLWKQPKSPSTDERIKEMWYTYTMQNYSAFKRKDFLIHAATWMNLKDIMLSEISQSQKDKYYMISLICNT